MRRLGFALGCGMLVLALISSCAEGTRRPESTGIGTGGADHLGGADAGGQVGLGGAAGIGSTAGTSSSATGGATNFVAINPNCDVVSADGSAPLMDDFEDGDPYPLDSEGRNGAWWGSADTVTGSAFARGNELAPAGHEPSLRAWHMQGTGHSDWGAVMGLTFRRNATDPSGVDSGCPYDVSAYRGVTFWAVGTGEELRVKASMLETTPVKDGGICALADPNGCWDDHGESVTLGTTWKQYTIPFSSMMQQGWGAFSIPFNAQHVMMLRFQTAAGDDFNYWIDDVAFVP